MGSGGGPFKRTPIGISNEILPLFFFSVRSGTIQLLRQKKERREILSFGGE